MEWVVANGSLVNRIGKITSYSQECIFNFNTNSSIFYYNQITPLNFGGKSTIHNNENTMKKISVVPSLQTFSFKPKFQSTDETKEITSDDTGNYVIPSTVDKLYKYLLAAMSLELSTLPLYITAWLSFKPDIELSDTAKEAKALVRTIMMEEMLHMNLVNNVIVAIYGNSKTTVKFNIPYGKGCKLPADVRSDLINVSLKPYSKAQIYGTFIQIETARKLTNQFKPIKQGMSL